MRQSAIPLLRWLLPIPLFLLSGCEEEPTQTHTGSGTTQPSKSHVVAVVNGLFTARAFPAEAAAVRACHARVGACLDEAGLPWESLTDRDVEAGRLSRFRVAVFPYNAKITAAEAVAIQQFAGDGGKLIWFYSVDRRIAPLLGVTTGALRRAAYKGQYHSIGFGSKGPSGLPQSVKQDSWHCLEVTPAQATQVIAHWVDADGHQTDVPAATMSPSGVWFAHVLLGGDLPAKGRMLLALLGHYRSELWAVAAESAMSRACRVSNLTSFGDLSRRVEAAEDSAPRYAKAVEALKAVQVVRERVHRLAAEKRYEEAFAQAKTARKHALRTYEYLQSSRQHEFRGVWIHTAYGVSDWGWERSLRVLADNGFNAVIPNMCWGGKADYYSSILPVTRKARERGDQLTECMKWARRYGLEVHVWKVCYNLSTAPNWFVRQLRSERRLQKGRNGRELRQKWLCPSNEKNIALERDSLLEVVRKYKADGIHLDYIRYPSSAGCYCQNCQREFEERIGRTIDHWPTDLDTHALKDEWLQFRRDQITRLVRAVRGGLRRLKSDAKLSAAVYGSWKPARVGIAQDARAWADEGLVDFLCPMNYTNSLDFQRKLTNQQMRALYGRIPLYAGIGLHSAQSRFTSTDQLIDQIQLVREAGADGFVVFQYRRALAADFLPALNRGVTAQPAVQPHSAPAFSFDLLRSGSAAFASPTFRAGEPISATVRFPREPGSSQIAVDQVRLARLDGAEVATFDAKPAQGSPLLVSITPSEGRYRFGIEGTHHLGDASPVSFLWQSPVVRVAHHALVEAEEWKDQPPPKGRGLRVGIYQGGFGSTGIFIALRRRKELLPFYIREVESRTLAECRVIVLPQPRDAERFDESHAEALRAWVERGGGLLLTHDACGYRKCHSLFPELWTVTGHPRGKAVRVAKAHALSEDLQPGTQFEHSYYDHLVLEAADQDLEAIITDSRDRPVIVAVEVGSGRVVASGMALGLAVGEEDVEPRDEEATLLRNAVDWLAGP